MHAGAAWALPVLVAPATPLETHPLPSSIPLLVPLKETDTQCCPRLRLVCVAEVVEEPYRTFGLGITGQAIVWASGQEPLSTVFPGLRSLKILSKP